MRHGSIPTPGKEPKSIKEFDDFVQSKNRQKQEILKIISATKAKEDQDALERIKRAAKEATEKAAEEWPFSESAREREKVRRILIEELAKEPKEPGKLPSTLPPKPKKPEKKTVIVSVPYGVAPDEAQKVIDDWLEQQQKKEKSVSIPAVAPTTTPWEYGETW